MHNTEKEMRRTAAKFVAAELVVSLRWVNMAIANQRHSATAETCRQMFREKFAQLKKAAEAPFTTPNST